MNVSVSHQSLIFSSTPSATLVRSMKYDFNNPLKWIWSTGCVCVCCCSSAHSLAECFVVIHTIPSTCETHRVAHHKTRPSSLRRTWNHSCKLMIILLWSLHALRLFFFPRRDSDEIQFFIGWYTAWISFISAALQSVITLSSLALWRCLLSCSW